ncbi:MAG TPA: hypothetical protein PKD05_21470, partial [Candidatus Melainabacteria bacterium]|nr:hypothetical protein [Candidatus Melainabacteria bacterium]
RCIVSAEEILHLENSDADKHKQIPVVKRGWLPQGTDKTIRIGITAGASTPNQVVADVIEHILSLKAKPQA